MEDTALAQQLIDTVRRTVNAEAALVQDRVAYALDYIRQVSEPNRITLIHIESMLSGGYDSLIRATHRVKAEAAVKSEKES